MNSEIMTTRSIGSSLPVRALFNARWPFDLGKDL